METHAQHHTTTQTQQEEYFCFKLHFLVWQSSKWGAAIAADPLLLSAHRLPVKRKLV
jgi:hypothetical protein